MLVFITIHFQVGGDRELCLGDVVEPGACLDLIIGDGTRWPPSSKDL